MANLRDIRRRINSVKSTQKITRAMKMVAAAKLRRTQDAIVQTRPYAYKMRDLVAALAGHARTASHPLLRADAGGKVDLIVVTGDRGLCGSFNSNIAHATMRALREQLGNRPVELTVIGRKGVELLRRRPCTIRETHTNLMDGNLMRSSAKIIDGLTHNFVRGDSDALFCLYNEFKSAISQRVVLEQLLPFEAPKSADHEVQTDYEYEPSPAGVFEALLYRHLKVQMHRMLLESAASEQGARMTAMDSATENAGDVITRLTLQYNRARQDAITKELIEVVSGAEAL